MGVPEAFDEAARWILEQLLRQGGCEVNFTGPADADLIYSEAHRGDSRLHLKADLEAIGRMLDGHRFSEKDFTNAETPFGSVPVLRREGMAEGDLVASAFFFLSGYDEHVATGRDRHGRYAYSGSIHERLETAQIPMVDWIAASLRPQLRQAGIASEEPRSWYVCPTVDVDYLRKWRPGIIFRELVEKPFFGKGTVGERFARWSRSVGQMTTTRGIYRKSLEHIAEVVKHKGGQATFFVKTGAREPYDVDYGAAGYLQDTVAKVERDGHATGLHPSYWVSSNRALLHTEVEKFTQAFGHAPQVSRMHYLKWNDGMGAALEYSGFAIDSTLGFADQPGFRRGTCHPFRLFDFETWRGLDIVEVPLLVMDSVLFNRLHLTVEEAVAATLKVVETCRTVGGCAVLLWHNIILDEVDHPGWSRHFSEVMDGIDASATIATLQGVVDATSAGSRVAGS